MKDLLPDICDKYEESVQLLEQEYKDYGHKKSFYGELVTLRCFHDNSLVRDIVSENGKGKVLFIDGNGSCKRALLGDQLAMLAVKNGWEGIIVHGAVRDIATLSGLKLGVKALGACPFKTEKRGAGEANVGLTIHNQMIQPGDYVYADLNGILLSSEALDLSKL